MPSRRISERAKQEIALFGGMALVVVALIAICYWCLNSEIPKRSREQIKAQANYYRTHPASGVEIESKDGILGTVTRKCWLGSNRYEIRLKTGEMTYINGKDFK